MVKVLRKTKKALAVVLTAGMLTGMVSTPIVAGTAGWRKNDTGWWYQKEDGSYPVNKWEKINGAWYYFNGNGYMLENSWKKDTNGKWYYLGADGAMVTNTWIREYDKNYEESYMWDWDHEKDSWDWYYVGADGVMKTNAWVKDSGLWYYLTADGTMKEGGFVQDAGKKYYVDYNGVMQTGVIEDGGCIYYFGTDGAMQNGNIKINGVNYFFSEYDGYIGSANLVADNKRFVDGIPCVGKWHQIGDGDCEMHFTCAKEHCAGSKKIDFTMQDGEYFNAWHHFDDYGLADDVDGMWEAHVFYREGNYLDAYNSWLKEWNVSSKGTISTPCGTMNYILEHGSDGTTNIGGFVQVDDKHYVRMYFEYYIGDSESKVVSEFSNLAKKLTPAR